MRGVPGSFFPSRSRSGAMTGLSAIGFMPRYCDVRPDPSAWRFTISPTSDAKTEKLQGSDNISLTFEHGTVPHITGAGNTSEHSIRNHEEREVDTRGGVL